MKKLIRNQFGEIQEVEVNPNVSENGRMLNPTSNGKIVAAVIQSPAEKASWQRNPLDEMFQTYRNLSVKNAQAEAAIQARAQALTKQENMIASETMRNALPAGVADLHKIISPYIYTFQAIELAPGQTDRSTIIISNEAPFVLQGMMRAVFLKTLAGPVYINPEDRNIAFANSSPGLSFTITDEGSTKPFMKDPIPIDAVAAPHFPFVYPYGHLFLAKTAVTVTYTNEHPTNTYIPFMTFIGAKLFIDPKGNLGSLQSAQ